MLTEAQRAAAAHQQQPVLPDSHTLLLPLLGVAGLDANSDWCPLWAHAQECVPQIKYLVAASAQWVATMQASLDDFQQAHRMLDAEHKQFSERAVKVDALRKQSALRSKNLLGELAARVKVQAVCVQLHIPDTPSPVHSAQPPS